MKLSVSKILYKLNRLQLTNVNLIPGWRGFATTNSLYWEMGGFKAGQNTLKEFVKYIKINCPEKLEKLYDNP